LLRHDLDAKQGTWTVSVAGLRPNAAAMVVQGALGDLQEAQLGGSLAGLPTLLVHTTASQQAQVQVRLQWRTSVLLGADGG